MIWARSAVAPLALVVTLALGASAQMTLYSVSANGRSSLIQCITQLQYSSGSELMGQGCNLHDPSWRYFSNATTNWNVIAVDPKENTEAQYIENKAGNTTIYRCFGQGDEAAINAGEIPPEDLVGLGLPPNDTFGFVFSKRMQIPTDFISRVDADVALSYVVVENPITDSIETLIARAALEELQMPVQAVAYFYLDSNEEVILVSNSTVVSSHYGLIDEQYVPPQTRYIELVFITDDPYYAVGQVTFHILQWNQEYRNTAQTAINVTFVIALITIVLVPIALIIEDLIKRRIPTIRMIDMVHKQGSRLVRACAFTLMMSSLLIVLQWIQTTDSANPTGVLPFFGGIDSSYFKRTAALKTIKTVVFITMFVTTGLIFWPIFVSYAHAAHGSRLAAILGFICTANFVILRTGLEYLRASPIKGFTRYVFIDIPEVLSYGVVAAFFLVNIVNPDYIGLANRKTYFKDVVYVRTLLTKIEVSEKPAPEPAPKGIMAIFTRRDTRPIWVRGRLAAPWWERQKAAYHSTRIPLRLVATIMMMCLFTYFNLIAIVLRVIDESPTVSCLFGIIGDTILQYFEGVSQLMGLILPLTSYGETLTDALTEISDEITRETKTANFVMQFYDVIFGSIITGCILAVGLLIFNICGMILQFNDDIRRLRVGDYSRFTPSEIAGAASSSAIRYMGVQIGFVFIGTFYTMIILQILCFALAMFFVYPFFRNLLLKFILQNGLMIVSIVVSLILSYMQQFIVEWLFVAWLQEDDTVDHSDPSKQIKGVKTSTRFWLTKIIGYNHIDYFFLFPNLISGLLTFISNLIFLVIGTALYSYRLDKKTELTVIRGQQITYLSYVLQEHHFSNPPLIVFCKILTDWADEFRSSDCASKTVRHITGTSYVDPEAPYGGVSKAGTGGPTPSHRVRIRWALLYTLARNPGLAKYRKHRVQDTYLAEYIAEQEAPLMRRRVVVQIRQEAGRQQEVMNEMRNREGRIYYKMKDDGFGRRLRGASARKADEDAAKGILGGGPYIPRDNSAATVFVPEQPQTEGFVTASGAGPQVLPSTQEVTHQQQDQQSTVEPGSYFEQPSHIAPPPRG
ncbi:hypothetical protein HK101_003981 [Irineochytrium annulatum]|nr:hypothetical protein HK101_003981 [Irineochytrium annulatum]